MSSKIVGNQYLYNGPGYLDAKIQPVESISDLDKILLRQRFIGLTVTVIHPEGPGSTPADYWLVQDPNEEEGVLIWQKKTVEGESISVDTTTPDYITVTKTGTVYYVDAAGNLVESLEQLKEDVADLESAITQTNERITTEVERIDAKDAEQDEKISNLETAVTEYNEKIIALETTVTEHEEKITNLETKDEEHDEKITTLEELVSGLTSKDEEHDEKISELEDLVSGLTSKDEEHDEKIANLEDAVSGLTAKDEEHDEAIARIDAKDAEQDAELERLAGLRIEKTETGGSVCFYNLVDASGTILGDTIEIMEEQYLEEVIYIPAATQEDKDIDPTVIIGDPYLKFIWRYGIITYVAIKDWVNDYFAGDGIAINPAHEISVKLAQPEEGSQNYLSIKDGAVSLNMEIEIDEPINITEEDLDNMIDNNSAASGLSTLLDGYSDVTLPGGAGNVDLESNIVVGGTGN